MMMKLNLIQFIVQPMNAYGPMAAYQLDIKEPFRMKTMPFPNPDVERILAKRTYFNEQLGGLAFGEDTWQVAGKIIEG